MNAGRAERYVRYVYVVAFLFGAGIVMTIAARVQNVFLSAVLFGVALYAAVGMMLVAVGRELMAEPKEDGPDGDAQDR